MLDYNLTADGYIKVISELGKSSGFSIMLPTK